MTLKLQSQQNKDILFSQTAVGKNLKSPVIVVGLPRSGSSYLAHLLSCTQDWFVFDDLYPYQRAVRHGLIGVNDLSTQKHLVKAYINSLTWVLRTKIKFEKNFSSQSFPDLTWDDTEKMADAVFLALSTHKNVNWSVILDEWMTRLALYSGKSKWGYKTPKDYLNLEKLIDVFPEMKLIFLYRNPLKVMQSYKSLPRNVKGQGLDGSSRQYHPLIYSLYWRDALMKVQTFKSQTYPQLDIMQIKFEHMIQSPEVVGQEIAQFLDSPMVGDVRVKSANSSFVQGSQRELTGLEHLICLLINQKLMENKGYNIARKKIDIQDFWSLIVNTIDFCLYQIECVIQKPALRMDAISSFIKSLTNKKKYQS